MSSSGVISKKSRLKFGIAVVVVIHLAFFYGFWHVKAKQIGNKVVALDIYGDSVTDGFSYYSALPDANCLDVEHEQLPKPALQIKSQPTPVPAEKKSFALPTQEPVEPFTPQLPIQPAHAPSCKKSTPFPAGYEKLGDKGFVGLEVNLDKTGKIVRGEVDRSSGFPELDTAALKQVVETWAFEPCKKGSEAIACKHFIKFRWKDAK